MFGAEDIRRVFIQNDIAYMNVSQNFADVCGQMEARAEAKLVYAIVNTLTDFKDVNTVQFLVEGEVVEHFGSEVAEGELRIYLGGPLMRNVGLVLY